MATEMNLPRTKKQNNRKSGVQAANKKRRQDEAAVRQAGYDKLTLDQKLAQPHLGAKERAKLLKRKVK
jgi:hypothetical protein